MTSGFSHKQGCLITCLLRGAPARAAARPRGRLSPVHGGDAFVRTGRLFGPLVLTCTRVVWMSRFLVILFVVIFVVLFFSWVILFCCCYVMYFEGMIRGSYVHLNIFVFFGHSLFGLMFLPFYVISICLFFWSFILCCRYFYMYGSLSFLFFISFLYG